MRLPMWWLDGQKIPVSRLTESEASRLQKLEETLHKRVIGQEEAVSAVSKGCPPWSRGTQRPEASDRFVPVFLGPTGVGKTEVSKHWQRLCLATRNP